MITNLIMKCKLLWEKYEGKIYEIIGFSIGLGILIFLNS
jgi:hypothetical protein